MYLLEKFAPQKKKKTLVLTNVGKRAVGRYYIPVGSVYLKKSESLVPDMKEHTCLHREPARKGRKKKKNPGINPGQPAGKGREKKTMVLTNGSCCAARRKRAKKKP
jgi:hypothetical protein